MLNRSEGALQSFKKLKELKSGNTFGEFTFTNIGEPRKYAIRCIEDCHLAYLERKEFFDLIQELRETISKQITSLKENPVFQYGWNQYDLMRFAISFTINHFTREMAIFKEGEKDRMIYFLNTGEVRSFKRIHNDKLDAGKGADKNAVKTYKNISLSLWKEGMIFGDEEFLKLRKGSNDPYGASNEDVNTCIREVTAVVNTANAEVWTMDAEVTFHSNF